MKSKAVIVKSSDGWYNIRVYDRFGYHVTSACAATRWGARRKARRLLAEKAYHEEVTL